MRPSTTTWGPTAAKSVPPAMKADACVRGFGSSLRALAFNGKRKLVRSESDSSRVYSSTMWSGSRSEPWRTCRSRCPHTPRYRQRHSPAGFGQHPHSPQVDSRSGRRSEPRRGAAFREVGETRLSQGIASDEMLQAWWILLEVVREEAHPAADRVQTRPPTLPSRDRCLPRSTPTITLARRHRWELRMTQRR